MTSDMRHMNYLTTVTARDVDVLREKETTYQGSWKAAGGRSAWFMLRRNMDRLLVMMEPPAPPEGYESVTEAVEDAVCAVQSGHRQMARDGSFSGPTVDTVRGVEWMRDLVRSEDIFAKIEEHPAGEDGTVLAVLRDLRRYLVLVESEMTARGVVQFVPPKEGNVTVASHEQLAARAAGPVVTDETLAAERRVPRFDSVEHDAVEPESRPRTPEDGGQHAGLAPWVCGPNYFAIKNVPVAMRSVFWNQRAPKMHVLEPHVNSRQIPRVLNDHYDLRPGTDEWILRIKHCPPGAREFFPSLPRELNMTEHEALPKWQCALYDWNETACKFELAERNAAWHVEAE